jgi:SAM-dependent methyltransferase
MNYSGHRCPLCGSISSTYEEQDLYRCGACGAAFNDAHRALDYDNDYFIAGYRAQYGRTYEEDYPHIYAMAVERLKRIDALRGANPGPRGALLDIGCALGFFLKAARDTGYSPVRGVEISEYAALYCREKLGIDVHNVPFSVVPGPEKYSVISAWYFIEHCADPVSVIRNIYESLERGGVFAFSSPSVFGPLYRFDRKRWIETHPVDHRVDFTPPSVKLLLKAMGFRRVRVYPSGIHPERVISRNSFFYPLFAALYRKFSRLTAYSDTIEVYALK